VKQHLSGRNAVITGSSMGIGKAIALEFARQGANVVVNSSASEAAMMATVDEIRSMGGKSAGYLGSVADYDAAGKLVGTCVDAFGSIDILVNVAGIAEPVGSTILNIDPQDWHRLIDVQLHGTLMACTSAACWTMA